jgi:hypothetical protein
MHLYLYTGEAHIDVYCKFSLVLRRPDFFNTRERKRGSLVCEVTCAASQTFHWHTSVAVSPKREVSMRLVDVMPHPVALAQQPRHHKPRLPTRDSHPSPPLALHVTLRARLPLFLSRALKRSGCLGTRLLQVLIQLYFLVLTNDRNNSTFRCTTT